MEKSEIKRLLLSMQTRDNQNAIITLLGELDMITTEDLNKYLQNSNDEIFIKTLLQKEIDKIQSSAHTDSFVPVNEMFSYGRSGSTIHMHLIPSDLRDKKESLGEEGFYEFYKNQLEDFLGKLQSIVQQDSSITQIFAVSPIFYNENIKKLHEDLGFAQVREIINKNSDSALENDNIGEDNMSESQKQRFLDMFNNGSKKRRVFYTSMDRNYFLSLEYNSLPANTLEEK